MPKSLLARFASSQITMNENICYLVLQIISHEKSDAIILFSFDETHCTENI